MKKRFLSIFLLCIMVFSMIPVSKAEAAQKPYYITVNLTKNIVTVYEKDGNGNYTVPKKAFFCSGGEETPEGTFKTTDKYVWRELFGNVYGQYATRITGHILFHSVPYVRADKGALEYWEYNKLGNTASAGCIRLTVEDVKWIYDNCPSGTTVKMYRGNVQEPLQPKPVLQIDAKDTLRRGWDPTDPDPANPWKKHGEMRQLKQESAGKKKILTAYKEDWNYYLKTDDAESLFADLGATIALADSPALINSGMGTGWYYGSQYKLPCYQMNGDVYYRLRDVADMAKTSISWDAAKQKIQLNRLQEKASLLVMAKA